MKVSNCAVHEQKRIPRKQRAKALDIGVLASKGCYNTANEASANHVALSYYYMRRRVLSVVVSHRSVVHKKRHCQTTETIHPKDNVYIMLPDMMLYITNIYVSYINR